MILVLQDAGANEDIDSAILRLVGKGTVSGISVFATGNNAARMIAKADSAGVAVGAHLAINASKHYRLQYTQDHPSLGIFSGDPMPVCKDDRLSPSDLRTEFYEQMSIISDLRSRPPDYFDCHCYHIREHPELYRALLDSFGAIPLIQRNDPYEGTARRFAGKIQCGTLDGARKQIARFGRSDMVFSHVAENILHSWKMSYLSLLKKRLPVTIAPFFEQETPCES